MYSYKNILKGKWIMVIGLSFLICHLSYTPVSAQKQLLILHTNDTHSTVLPLNCMREKQ